MVAINKISTTLLMLCLATFAIAQINIHADKWFTSGSECIRNNINSEYPSTLLMNTNEFGIPIGNCEAIVKTDYFETQIEHDYYLYDRNSVDISEGTLKTIDLMLRYNINGWKIGLANVLREQVTPKITYNKYLRAELSRQFHSINADTKIRVFYENSLNKLDDFDFNYSPLTSGLFNTYNCGFDANHHVGLEFDIASPLSKDEAVVPVYFPLVFAPEKSYSVAAKCSYSDLASKHAHYSKREYSNTEVNIASNFKANKQLELTCNVFEFSINAEVIDNDSKYNGSIYRLAPGFTFYPLEYGRAVFLINTSYLYNYEYYHDSDSYVDYHEHVNSSYIIPTGGVYIKMSRNLILNCLFSRNYSTRNKPTDDSFTYLNIFSKPADTWNCYLGMNLGY